MKTLASVDSSTGCGVWGTTARLSAPHAALVNGTLVQSFELDDVHRQGVLHVGAVTLPALFAVAETRPGMTGRDFLTAAVAGYQHQLEGVQARMAEIRSALGVKGPSSAMPTRKISAAGRARMAAAQRARWAASKKQAAPASKPAKATRRLSAAGRAAIVAATKKRWAAVRAAKR